MGTAAAWEITIKAKRGAKARSVSELGLGGC